MTGLIAELGSVLDMLWMYVFSPWVYGLSSGGGFARIADISVMCVVFFPAGARCPVWDVVTTTTTTTAAAAAKRGRR